MNRLHRYIFLQLLSPFILNIFFFTFLFLITQLLEIANLLLNYHVGLLSILKLLAYAAPFFLQFTIPMSVMISVLVSFLSFSADKEILVLKAAGYNILRLIYPLLAFCTLAALLTALMTFYGLPLGKLKARYLLTELAMQHSERALKPMVFNNFFSDTSLYTGDIKRSEGRLKDVFIEDLRKDGLGSIFAPEALMEIDGRAGRARLELFNGMLLKEDKEEGDSHLISFKNYELFLDFSEEKAGLLKVKKNEKEEMLFKDLKVYIKGLPEKSKLYNAALMKLHEKFSLPMACFALALLVFPLGIKTLDRSKNSGLISGLSAFFLYYSFLTMAWSFGESGRINPAFAVWLPDIITFVLALYFLYAIGREKPLFPSFNLSFLKRSKP